MAVKSAFMKKKNEEEEEEGCWVPVVNPKFDGGGSGREVHHVGERSAVRAHEDVRRADQLQLFSERERRKIDRSNLRKTTLRNDTRTHDTHETAQGNTSAVGKVVWAIATRSSWFLICRLTCWKDFDVRA
jgi:hypothetical protein